MNLYDISDNIKKCLDAIPEDASPELMHEATEAIDLLEDAFNVKVSNIARYIKNLSAFESACKDEEERLSSRRKAAANKAAKLKSYLTVSMHTAGVKKVEGPLTVALQKNPPTANVYDESMIPEDCYKVVPEKRILEKREVLKKLKLGENVPGAELKQTESVRIR